MASHNDLGLEGEDLAAKHLVKSGYKILERNRRFGKEEIDIIARLADDLVIVEVKTRNSNFFGVPHEFVTKGKQSHIIRVANAYIEKHDLDLETRFDVIGIIINSKGKTIDHI